MEFCYILLNELENAPSLTESALKHNKSKKEKKERKREKQPTPPIASSSRANGKAKPVPKKKSAKKAVIPDDDVLSFEQKKELSDSIGRLDGAKLERVIQIIHEGVPGIRDVRFSRLCFP